jgi:hypothetical protein
MQEVIQTAPAYVRVIYTFRFRRPQTGIVVVLG